MRTLHKLDSVKPASPHGHCFFSWFELSLKFPGIFDAQRPENAKQVVDDLAGELQDWHDNLPENMQGGYKADQLDEAIGALESLSSDLESIDVSGVEFPSMMG